MTRRPGAVADDTRARLIAAATVEFAERGYRGASIRSICAAAGVTTGALYFFFASKEELFEAVVSPVMERIAALLRAHHAGELDMGVFAHDGGLVVRRDAFEGGAADAAPSPGSAASDAEVIESIVRAAYCNRTAVGIALANRDLPCVQRFFDGLVAVLDEQTRRLLAAWNPALLESRSFSPFMVHWYSHQQIDVTLSVLEHDLLEEEAVDAALAIGENLVAGFYALAARAAWETGVLGEGLVGELPWGGCMRIAPPSQGAPAAGGAMSPEPAPAPFGSGAAASSASPAAGDAASSASPAAGGAAPSASSTVGFAVSFAVEGAASSAAGGAVPSAPSSKGVAAASEPPSPAGGMPSP